MLEGIYGNIGSGKTILAVNQAVECYLTYPESDLRANFKIDLPNFKRLEVENLLEIEKKEDVTRVIGDELYTWLEARVSPSKLNRFVSYILFQSRKKNIDVVGTAQLKSTIDTRFKDLEHITVYAYPRIPRSEEDFNYAFVTDTTINYFTVPYKKTKKLQDLYDSDEVIMPLDINELKEEIIYANPQKIKEKLESLVVKLNKEEMKSFKVTHDSVKDLLISMSESIVIEPYLYARLKTLELRNKLKDS